MTRISIRAVPPARERSRLLARAGAGAERGEVRFEDGETGLVAEPRGHLHGALVGLDGLAIPVLLDVKRPEVVQDEGLLGDGGRCSLRGRMSPSSSRLPQNVSASPYSPAQELFAPRRLLGIVWYIADMPIHDWSRVDAGVFHDLHVTWIAGLKSMLNERLLPDPFYAIAEPALGEAIPDILTLQSDRPPSGGAISGRSALDDSRDSAVENAPVPVIVQDLEPADPYLLLSRHILIRESLREDRTVAVVELVSRGNKTSRQRAESFVDKGVSLLRGGVHLVIVDLQPPTGLVEHGFHARISEAYGNPVPHRPGDRLLEAVSYQVLEGGFPRAHVVPLKVGDILPAMPAFLTAHQFVRLPLEETYVAAIQSLAGKFRKALEAS